MNDMLLIPCYAFGCSCIIVLIIMFLSNLPLDSDSITFGIVRYAFVIVAFIASIYGATSLF